MKKCIALCEPDMARKREITAAFGVEDAAVVHVDDMEEILSILWSGRRFDAVLCPVAVWQQFFQRELLLFETLKDVGRNVESQGAGESLFVDGWREFFPVGKPTVAEDVISLFRMRQIFLFLSGEQEDQELELEFLKIGIRDYFWKERRAEIVARRICMSLTMGMPPGQTVLEMEEVFGLTGKERAVFSVLFEAADFWVTREVLLREVWHKTEDKSRCVDAVIRKLRRKICDSPFEIVTRYGEGYGIRRKE